MKVKISFVLTISLLLMIIMIALSLKLGTQGTYLINERYQLINNQSEASNIYKNSFEICKVGKNKKTIRKLNTKEILKTKPVVVEGEGRKGSFSLSRKSLSLSTTTDVKYVAIIHTCQLLQMYILWKENAGKLNSDKQIVEYTYNVLSKIGIAGINVNGKRDDGYIANIAYIGYFDLNSPLYKANGTGYTKTDLRDIAIEDLGDYKSRYETNSENFSNVDLYTKYSLLRYLRYSRTLNDTQISYFPIFQLFNIITSNLFYEELFRVSKNATRNITLTYHISRKTTTDRIYFAK